MFLICSDVISGVHCYVTMLIHMPFLSNRHNVPKCDPLSQNQPGYVIQECLRPGENVYKYAVTNHSNLLLFSFVHRYDKGVKYLNKKLLELIDFFKFSAQQ